MWNKNKKITILLLIILILNIFLISKYIKAASLDDAFGDAYLNKAAGIHGAGYDTTADTENIISMIIKIALSFLGVIFLVLMIYGGYLWMMAKGNEEQVTKAKNLIIAAVIGLVIVLAAYAISWFVISKLGGTTLK